MENGQTKWGDSSIAMWRIGTGEACGVFWPATGYPGWFHYVSLTDRSASQGFPTEMNRFTKTDYHNNGPKNCVRRPKIQMFGLANEPLSMGMIRIPCLLAVYKKHIFRHIQTWFANLGSRRRRSRSFQEHCSFTFFAFRVAEFWSSHFRGSLIPMSWYSRDNHNLHGSILLKIPNLVN